MADSARYWVRAASLSGYLELARSLGLDSRTLLRSAGLSVNAIADTETRISADAVRMVLESSARAAGIEDFGIRLASTRRLSNLGPVSLVLREEPTGLQALDTLCRYLRLLNASLITRVVQAGEKVMVREQILSDTPGETRQAIQLAIGVMYRILAELLGPGWQPRLVCFTHSKPIDLRAHQALFGHAIEFDAEFNGIVCARRDLERQLPRTDPDMARYARQYLDRTLGQSRTDTRETVAQLIRALLPGGRCTAEQVAQHLRVDRRTIYRWLVTEGASFSQILDQVRSELAENQIRDRDAPLVEVADLLGFSGQSSFAHWFRGHFGCSVTQWRRRIGMRPP